MENKSSRRSTKWDTQIYSLGWLVLSWINSSSPVGSNVRRMQGKLFRHFQRFSRIPFDFCWPSFLGCLKFVRFPNSSTTCLEIRVFEDSCHILVFVLILITMRFSLGFLNVLDSLDIRLNLFESDLIMVFAAGKILAHYTIIRSRFIEIISCRFLYLLCRDFSGERSRRTLRTRASGVTRARWTVRRERNARSAASTNAWR